MKKAVCIFVALFAFACGVFVFYVQPLLVPISLFELRYNAAQYKSRKFRVTGKLTVWKAESDYYFDLKDWEGVCSGDVRCGFSLRIPEEIKRENVTLLEMIAEKNHTIGKTDFRHIEYFAEVEIIGLLIEEEQTGYFPGIYDVIKVEKIKQFSPVNFVRLEDIEQR